MRSNQSGEVSLRLLEKGLIYNSTTILNEVDIVSALTHLKDNTKIVELAKRMAKSQASKFLHIQRENAIILIKNHINSSEINRVILENIHKNKSKLESGIKSKNFHMVTTSISATIVDIKEDLQKRGLFKFDSNTPSNVIAAFFAFIWMALVNGFFLVALTNILGAGIGFLLFSLIVAPFVEEFYKYLLIKSNRGSEALLVFNALEFISYYKSLVSKGGNKLMVIIVRLIAVVMHYTTAHVQLKYQNKNEEEAGYYVAVAIHALYNTFALLFDSKLVMMMGLTN